MWLLYASIANILWAISDIGSSILVKHYEKNPLRLAWRQSMFDLCYLGIASLFLDIHTNALPLYILAGVCAYGGFLMFLYTVDRLDASVMSASWAVQAIFIAIIGTLFFADTWTLLQAIGVIATLLGITILSFTHQHRSLAHTLALLGILGLFYTPFFVIQKYTLLHGESVAAAFFWPVLSSKILAFFFPLISGRVSLSRKSIALPMRLPFFLFMLFTTMTSIAGFYPMTKAYELGLTSLVAMAENSQPFFVIAAAWISVKLLPSRTPKELLTTQSVTIKVVSFCIVFGGLAMLTV